MEPARAESVVRAVEGWRAAVRRGAAAWDALARALAALAPREDDADDPQPVGGDRQQQHEARMRVYEDLLQEAPSAALSAFVERQRTRGPGAGSRARRRRGEEEHQDGAAPSTFPAAVVSAPQCAFADANGGRSAAEALQSALVRLRESLEDAEDAHAVLNADAEALEREAQRADAGDDAAALEAALLCLTAARAMLRELGWMRRAVAGAGPTTSFASAEAAAGVWRLQPFTDDEAVDALLGGAERIIKAAKAAASAAPSERR